MDRLLRALASTMLWSVCAALLLFALEAVASGQGPWLLVVWVIATPALYRGMRRVDPRGWQAAPRRLDRGAGRG